MLFQIVGPLLQPFIVNEKGVCVFIAPDNGSILVEVLALILVYGK